MSCVESVAFCAEVNPQTPGVNKWKDPNKCHLEALLSQKGMHL